MASPEEAEAAIEGLFETATRALKRGQFGSALSGYDQLLNFMEDPSIHLNRSVALAGLGRLEEALAAITRAIEMDPEPDPHFFIHRADCYDRLDRLPECLADYDHALALDPANVQAWNDRGVTLGSRGREQEALQDFRTGAERALDDEHLPCKVVVTLCGMGRFEEAVEAAGEYLARLGRSSQLHVERGIALDGLDRGAEARNDFDRAVQLDPGYARAWYSRAVNRAMRADFEGAWEDVSQALEIDPDYSKAWDFRHQLAWKLDRVGEEWARRSAARTLNPVAFEAYLEACEGRPEIFEEVFLRGGDPPGVIELGRKRLDQLRAPSPVDAQEEPPVGLLRRLWNRLRGRS